MPPKPRPVTAPAPSATPAVPETPLEDTNPPGAPEGVEQPSGDPEGHATPTGPADTVQPQGSDLHVANSTEDPDAYVLTSAVVHPVDALGAYLATQHPGDVVEGEHPATTAVRLLTRLGASTATGARCQAAYCNLPAGHTDAHGWVHVEPTTARG